MKKILVILMLISLSFAGVNINGTTGYLVIPTAEGLRAQEYTLGMNAYSHTDDVHAHWKYYGGIGTHEGMEVSVCGRSEREGVFANVKWFGELSNYQNPLMVGMGFENLSSLGTLGDYPNMYMVMTKKFFNGSSFSIGAAGRYINKNINVSMIAGTEIFFSNYLSFLVDFTSFEKERYLTNAGFRFYTDNAGYFSLTVLNATKNSLKDYDRDIDEDISYSNTNSVIATIGWTYEGFL